MKFLKPSLFAALAVMLIFYVQTKASFHPLKHAKAVFIDTTKKDTVIYETIKGLPLKAQRKANLTTSEGTWTSLVISPDGKTIVFDMMGDIYTVSGDESQRQCLLKPQLPCLLQLEQYSKYYHTNYIKMYVTGNRQQRQWIIMAAKNQHLMPTTEGALNFKLNMTNLLDGYPGHKHSIPVYPLYKDVIKTIADAKITVTPTLLVA